MNRNLKSAALVFAGLIAGIALTVSMGAVGEAGANDPANAETAPAVRTGPRAVLELRRAPALSDWPCASDKGGEGSVSATCCPAGFTAAGLSIRSDLPHIVCVED